MRDVTMEIVREHQTETWASSVAEAWLSDEIRILAKEDPYADVDSLKGNTYKPELHPDIALEQIQREESEFEERARKEGIFGLIGEFRAQSGAWEHADSVWGFVGNDYLGSGYDADICQATLQGFYSKKKEMVKKI